jgi:hypothetical protein
LVNTAALGGIDAVFQATLGGEGSAYWNRLDSQAGQNQRVQQEPNG